MTSEIDKLKHFHVENYSDTNFTDDLNDWMYQQVIEDVTVELEEEAYKEMRNNK